MKNREKNRKQNKMVDLSLNKLIILLNKNDLNTLTERLRLVNG